MKKIFKSFAAIAVSALMAFSCQNNVNDNSLAALFLSNAKAEANAVDSGSRDLVPETECTVPITVNVLYADLTKDWCAWAWTANVNPERQYVSEPWGTFGITFKKDSTNTSMLTTSFSVNPAYDLGILFVTKDTSTQTGNIVIPKEKLVNNAQFYFIYGSATIYDSAAACSGLKSASITAKDGKTLKLSVYGKKDAAAADFTIKDSTGAALTVSNVSATDTSAVLTLSNGNIANIPYTVTVGTETVKANIVPSLIDDLGLVYDGNDLGLTLSGSTATFKTWAPTAASVKVLLYTDVTKIGNFKDDTVKAKASGSCDEVTLKGTPSEELAMTKGEKGVWSLANVNVTSYKYYKYEIAVSGKTYYVCDLWANVAAGDSLATQIATINDAAAVPAGWTNAYVNPFGSTGTETKKYNDAVIYEMHIRDWSRAVVSDSTGKFLDFANDTIINHLKDLGVTHVQILPMFDYAQVNSDENYNWGYNPYNYNVPEGRYVTKGYTDGTQAVNEMRTMIKKLHDNGIAVIMDVVYNHTSAKEGGSLYDSTVPGYFYRLQDDGSYYNGSGCGNEIATNNKMVKKFVIDSLKHWMNDYHINGFRFDLMGCLESATMKEIYETLYAIDKNVLVYGEPWTGGTSGVKDGAVAAVKAGSGYGVGAFDDDYRDAIKGGEFGGFALGQVQGTFNDANIVSGLKGDQITKNNRNATGITGLALHYAECHDNYTLFDKLIYSTIAPLTGDFAPKFAAAYSAVMADATKVDLIKKQVKLAGAYVILGQGTPFLNGGQEFMRTKKGDPDSYAPDNKGGIKWTSRYNGGEYVASTDIDDVNSINLGMKTTYSDVYNTYKGLIALRKSSTAFTSPSKVEAETVVAGVTKYTVSNGTDTFEVLLNATDKDYHSAKLVATGTVFGAGVNDSAVIPETIASGKLCSVDSGAVAYGATSTDVRSVAAKSFVILKK